MVDLQPICRYESERNTSNAPKPAPAEGAPKLAPAPNPPSVPPPNCCCGCCCCGCPATVRKKKKRLGHKKKGQTKTYQSLCRPRARQSSCPRRNRPDWPRTTAVALRLRQKTTRSHHRQKPSRRCVLKIIPTTSTRLARQNTKAHKEHEGTKAQGARRRTKRGKRRGEQRPRRPRVNTCVNGDFFISLNFRHGKAQITEGFRLDRRRDG